jgi:membrane protein implicated in regulation of membrane protease activity
VGARRHGSRGAAVVMVMMALHFLSRAPLLLRVWMLLLLLLLLLLLRAGCWARRLRGRGLGSYNRDDRENDRAAQKGCFFRHEAVFVGLGKEERGPVKIRGSAWHV